MMTFFFFKTNENELEFFFVFFSENQTFSYI